MTDIPADAVEAVVQWMIANGYATGHGDTLDDLLRELVGHGRDTVIDAVRRVANELSAADTGSDEYARGARNGSGQALQAALTTLPKVSDYEAAQNGRGLL